jgi:hypothetical protein
MPNPARDAPRRVGIVQARLLTDFQETGPYAMGLGPEAMLAGKAAPGTIDVTNHPLLVKYHYSRLTGVDDGLNGTVPPVRAMEILSGRLFRGATACPLLFTNLKVHQP